MSLLGEIVDAFRIELGGSPSRSGPGRRGPAPRCPRCELFVKRMCDEPYIPCGVCTDCCPGYDTHQPAKRDPT